MMFLGHKIIVTGVSPIPSRFRINDRVIAITPAEHEKLRAGDGETFKKLAKEILDHSGTGEGET